MKAFHNDPAIKKKYLARVRAHQKADELIRGTGWDGSKGCAVGCTLNAYDHSRYPIELGIPEWLARVEDRLFEGMSQEKSKTWPEKFLAAIPVGADCEKALSPFMLSILRRVLGCFDNAAFSEVTESIHSVIALYEIGEATEEDFREAEAAAARASAAAARAARAAWAAWAAAEAAAEAAAAATSRTAAYDEMGDDLLKILRGLK